MTGNNYEEIAKSMSLYRHGSRMDQCYYEVGRHSANAVSHSHKYRGGSRRHVLAGGLIAFLTFAVGCGGGTCSVSGDVKFNGHPVPEGSIRLDPVGESDAPPASAIIKDGKYEIPSSTGLRPGKYRVSITAIAKTGRQVKAFEKLEGESGKVEQMFQYIPSIYNRDTTLEVELAAGENAGKTFELLPQS